MLCTRWNSSAVSTEWVSAYLHDRYGLAVSHEKAVAFAEVLRTLAHVAEESRTSGSSPELTVDKPSDFEGSLATMARYRTENP